MAEPGNIITLRFINNLTEPNFDFQISLQTSRALTILQLLEQAAWKDPTFQFCITYFGDLPGYVLNSAGRGPQCVSVDEVNNSYWKIGVRYVAPQDVGISGFQPGNGDTVVFELCPRDPAPAPAPDDAE